MITAKDIWNLEQEMVSDLVYQMYQAGFDSDEKEQIFNEFSEMTEARYNELLKIVSDRQINPLARLKAGEGLLVKDINKAVRQAANDPNT